MVILDSLSHIHIWETSLSWETCQTRKWCLTGNRLFRYFWETGKLIRNLRSVYDMSGTRRSSARKISNNQLYFHGQYHKFEAVYQKTNKNIHPAHWGRVAHICVGNLTTIGSDNGLSPDRCQAIIWTSDGISLIGSLGTHFSEILVEIEIFSVKKMSSGNCRPFCLGLNVLKYVNKSKTKTGCE